MTLVDAIFYLTKVLTSLVLPPTGLILLALLSLLLLRRWPRAARVGLWFSTLTLLMLSLPIVARGLIGMLGAQPFDPKSLDSAQAVVILGGGLIRGTPEAGDTLSGASLARTHYGAKLAKEHRLPILVTGGRVFGKGSAEAEVMAQSLVAEFGIEPRWIETQSRHTAENARYSAELLKRDNIRHIILVTHDFHMRRSLAHCEAAGLICYPAPVRTISSADDSWIQELPNASALQLSSMALHEILGNMVLRWR